MREFERLKERVEKAADLIVSLKKEKERLVKDNEKLGQNLKFFEKESDSAKRLIANNERFTKERKVIRERLEALLNRLEELNI